MHFSIFEGSYYLWAQKLYMRLVYTEPKGSPILWCRAPVEAVVSKWLPLHSTSAVAAIGGTPREGNFGPLMGLLKSVLGILPAQTQRPPCQAMQLNMEDRIRQWKPYWSHPHFLPPPISALLQPSPLPKRAHLWQRVLRLWMALHQVLLAQGMIPAQRCR